MYYVFGLLLILFLVLSLERWIVSITDLKQYIIAHQHKIIVSEDNPYILHIPFCSLNYYTSVTIQKNIAVHDDYTITFWGNRRSKRWRFLMNEQLEIMPVVDREKGRYYSSIDANLIDIFNRVINFDNTQKKNQNN